MTPLVRFLSLSTLSAALLASTLGCVSGNAGGTLGASCQTNGDCSNQFECLNIGPDGGCSSQFRTCQQTCTSPASCLYLGGNYTCAMGACGAPDIAGICRAAP